jgi:NAD(P)-dependent dehydrogenase (short-subunit alcohol dehydrogenase family)
MNLFDLRGKIAVVSGGYGYLGRDMCLALAVHGADVFALGRSAEKFAEAFAGAPGVRFIQGDVADSTAMQTAFASIARDAGGIDVLVNNAFYSRGNQPLGLADADWAYGIDGSLNSVYRCIRDVVPYFKQRGGGRIVNIASMYGMVSPDFAAYRDAPQFTNPPHYGAAKAGVIQLTRYFAKYLGPDNIRVNAISPGPFPAAAVQKDAGFIGELNRRTALGRVGEPRELGGALVFLCSDASSFVTGHNLVVDGGWTIS